jgi:hypothetical protein
VNSPAPVQAAAEVNQPARTLDQRRQHVGSKAIYRESGGMALGCRSAALLRIDAGVVDDCVHASNGINLVCDTPDFGGTA